MNHSDEKFVLILVGFGAIETTFFQVEDTHILLQIFINYSPLVQASFRNSHIVVILGHSSVVQ